ncbi:MAG: type III polyketide synthase [Mangrovibacterium sp.]
MSCMISIGTSVPSFRAKQSDILGFMQAAYADELASRKLKALFKASDIDSRQSVVPDFRNRNEPGALFAAGRTPQVDERLGLFKEKALYLATEAVYAAFRKLNTSAAEMGITHLITVTCTGLYAPGLDTELIGQLGLGKDIFHVAVNFMGCNAAFPALKIAGMITQTDENAKVLVVCVELCTLHFQANTAPDHLLSNTVFSDGAAAAIVVPRSYARRRRLKNFILSGFYSQLIDQGKKLMEWNISPVSFEMVLNSRLPDLIGAHIGDVLKAAAKKLGTDPMTSAHWAVHPGGKKILDTIRDRVAVDFKKMESSYQVLHEYGNMSSPTILFVLERIMDEAAKPGELIFVLGFGPGISMDSSLFSYE